jgi:quinol monooxygenase YgiN
MPACCTRGTRRAKKVPMSIRHLVLWKLRDPADAPRFVALLKGCAGIVPGMLEFEPVARVPGLEANVDVALVSTFSDAAALAAYQEHPHHKEVSAQLANLRETRHVFDFET